MNDDEEDDAIDVIEPLEGFFVGSLSAEQIALFDALCERKICYYRYEGVGGFLGLAKVGIRRVIPRSAKPNFAC